MDTPYPPSFPGTAPDTTGQASPSSIQALAATRPWVFFCSIMGFIGAIFMVVYGIMMAFFGVMIAQPQIPPSSQMPPGAKPPDMTGFMSVMGVFYILLAFFYIFPSVKLWKFGSAIKRLCLSGSNRDLEQAIEQQRGFWKFVGILIVVIFVTSILFMIVAFVTMMASMPRPR
jgi:hypothetical protein